MKNKIINFIHNSITFFGFEITYSLDRGGLSLFGINVNRAKVLPKFKGSKKALAHCLQLKSIKTVLDVGSGGGMQANMFHQNGYKVTCIDFGTSIYASKAEYPLGIDIININFLDYIGNESYDLVWASHVLEHQKNVNQFIIHLQKCCRNEGYIAISLPYPHRRLWGGHLTLWSPGLLLYNLVMAGIDCSEAEIVYGYREFSVIVQNKKVTLPEITYDTGDLNILSKFLPKDIRENSDPWI